ncbi:carbonic anhydrase [Spirillospora sp. NPDC000708]
MTTLDTLLDRNRRFAAAGPPADLPLFPRLKTIVICCVDPRADPAAVLGLGLGDALVIRNLGGRFTPGTFRTMAALRAIAEAEGTDPGPGWNLVVLHHTDCGMTRLREHTGLLADVFGVDPGDLGGKAVGDPVAAVAADVAAIKANPFLPAAFQVSGLVHDLATGLVDVVVPPAPLRPGADAA